MGQSLRILIADDNPVNQKVAVAMLAKCGYEADVVSDGDQAVSAVKERAYDLVLMDVQMPVMDGLEATRRIINEVPAELRPRIVAMTAMATEQDRKHCLDAGMDDYVAKPVTFEGLREVLDGGAKLEGFDRDVVDRLRNAVGEDMFKELAQDFVDDLPRLTSALTAAAESGDVDAIKESAHELKGLAVLFGAVDLARACTDLHSLDPDAPGDLRSKVAAAVATCTKAAELTRSRQPYEPA